MPQKFVDALSSVRTGKLSERIADQLRSAILSGLMKPGDRLPSERGASRAFRGEQKFRA